MLLFRFIKAFAMYYLMVVSIHFNFLAVAAFFIFGMYDAWQFLQEVEKLVNEVGE